MKKISLRNIFLLLPVQYGLLAVLIVYVSEPGARIFIAPYRILIPALLTGLAALILHLVFLAATRNVLTAAIYASLTILAVFFLWQIFLLVLTVSFAAILLIRWRLRKGLLDSTAAALLAIALVLDVFYGIQFAKLAGLKSAILQPKSTAALPAVAPASAVRPDIYYIILDGYGRADMLQVVHGFDNSAFIAELEQRGFIVPTRSQANYPRTLLSLTSSLNMEYLDAEVAGLADRNEWWQLEPLLKHSVVRTLLEQAGYETIFFASGWDFTDIRDGDLYMRPFPLMLDDFERAFVEMTNLRFLADLTSDLVSLPNYNTHRRIISYQFQTLPEVASQPGPKFVFSHIASPHPPFVFAQDGTPIDPAYKYSLSYAQGIFGDTAQYRASYLAQLSYDNTLALTMIDGILSNSPEPPIIILQGDHGPGIYSDFNSLDDTCLYERFSILSAIYFPPALSAQLPENISPVNTFRLVFRKALNLFLPLLPERRYFSDNFSFYQFRDVTSQSETACNSK